MEKEKELQTAEEGTEPKWQRVDLKIIEELEKKEKDLRIAQMKAKRKLFLSRGLSSITSASPASFFDSLGGQMFDDMAGL